MSTISYFLQLERLDCGTVQYWALVPPSFRWMWMEKGRFWQRHMNIKTTFSLFFFKHGHMGATPKTKWRKHYQTILTCLILFVWEKLTLFNNYISFSGRAVFTDIHCMSYMLQYVGFDGSKRIWDCRKNYLNGMKYNVDIVQKSGEMDCISSYVYCTRKTELREYIYVYTVYIYTIYTSLWPVFLTDNEINCQSYMFWIIYRLARVKTSRGLFLNQGNVH